MHRRAFLGALAASAASLSPVADAQAPARTFRIGFLGGSSPTSPESRHIWQAFLDELRSLGYVEGRNLAIEGRYYGDHPERLPSFAAELAALGVDVIVAAAPPAPEAARRATSTIPIVMANHTDPVASGLVQSFAKPGANVTGLSLRASELRIKQLQLLKEVLPRLRRVALLRTPATPLDTKEMEVAARSLDVASLFVEARSPSELPAALASAARGRADALMVLGGSMFFAHRGPLAELAATHRLPTIYLLREFVEAGGLMSYGVDLRENFRRAAGYVDRILKGAHPGDLPIEQPSKFELAINTRTAKALGLTFPASMLVRADHIVE